jgi:FMNH2-dependent dimethyl sulfone monooxygenase
MVNVLGAGLVGTPEVIAQRLLRSEKIGLDCAMLRFTPMLEDVETSSSRVMPLVRAGGVFAGYGARCESADRHR